mmetsp:Transcript_39251/g.83820  ORF Transcript_39251/g.83820 Transcript_39251/m.83820 type:complete len:213 (+) Transcript_39251:929-1567(+)
MSGTLSPSSGPPKCGTPMRSSSSWMPTSPTTYTFLPVSLNLVCSRYAAAAKEEEKISSAGTSRPRLSNFFLYPARDLVELLVTKYIFLPRARSFARVSGMPSMTESPLQMTPSQSKMNTSTPGNRSFAGSVSLSTLAASAVVVDEKERGRGALPPPIAKAPTEPRAAAGAKVRGTAGEKARAADARERERAVLAKFMVAAATGVERQRLSTT